MKNTFVITLLLFFSFGAFAQHKIVFQMATDIEKEQSSLGRQINNVLNYWPDAQIEVVVHSAAIEFMMKGKSVVEDVIPDLQKR
jgi:intracellular sulfur oxidation DsrE/DsrF family protein